MAPSLNRFACSASRSSSSRQPAAPPDLARIVAGQRPPRCAAGAPHRCSARRSSSARRLPGTDTVRHAASPEGVPPLSRQSGPRQPRSSQVRSTFHATADPYALMRGGCPRGNAVRGGLKPPPEGGSEGPTVITRNPGARSYAGRPETAPADRPLIGQGRSGDDDGYAECCISILSLAIAVGSMVVGPTAQAYPDKSDVLMYGKADCAVPGSNRREWEPPTQVRFQTAQARASTQR
jgi:hypothetical protein